MNKTGLSWLNKVKIFSYKYEPEILIGVGIFGLISVAFMAAKAAIASKNEIEQKKKEIEKEEKIEVVEIPNKEKAKIIAQNCIAPAIVCLASTACIIGGTTIKFKRYSALATAFALTEAAAKEYQNKVVELIGNRKEEKIRDEIVESKITKDERPVNPSNVIVTRYGDMRCYDQMSDRYFNSDVEKIRRIVNELNRRMLDDMYISLNEFYEEMGLPSITIGNILGWNINHGYIELDYSSCLSPDGIPCLAINFNRSSAPIPDFEKV